MSAEIAPGHSTGQAVGQPTSPFGRLRWINVALYGKYRVSGSVYFFAVVDVFCAEIAQLVEHIHGKDGVPGSSPGLGSIWKFT